MDAKEAAWKIQMDKLEYDLRIGRATKESLAEHAKLEGAHGEGKSSSPEYDANADSSQSAGTGGGKPSSHHKKSVATSGSGDAKSRSSGKSGMEKAIHLTPADEAADDTSHDEGGEYTRSFLTENAGARRLMLQPGFSFRSQFGSVARSDFLNVRRFYLANYPETDPETFSQIVDHIIDHNEYSVRMAKFLCDVYSDIFFDADVAPYQHWRNSSAENMNLEVESLTIALLL